MLNRRIYQLANRLLQTDFLKEREKDIIKMRLGLEGYEPCTLQEIGDKYGITRERVRQIGIAIAKKVKKFFPEEKVYAGKIFIKAWEPKYLVKERRLIRKRAIIKRKKTLVRNRCEELEHLIEEFSKTGQGKEEIYKLFKELRIKHRKNKSLFEPDVEAKLRNLRQRWKEIRKGRPKVQGQTF